jgi:hypothetical protein
MTNHKNVRSRRPLPEGLDSATRLVFNKLGNWGGGGGKLLISLVLDFIIAKDIQNFLKSK